MTRIWWVRHGPTHEKGFVGWRDVPVDLSDTAKTERLDAYLPRRAILVSSDLERAIKTADMLNEARIRQPNEPDLREFDFGAWDGEVWEDIAARDPTLSRDFWDKPGDLAPPGGESWNAVSARVQAATARLVAAHPGRDIVLVAHFGAILTHMAGAGGLGAVPAAKTPNGNMLNDSLSIAWHLADAFADRGLLPEDPADRAVALNMIAEMHSGFTALRGACPMNLRTAWIGFEPSAAVLDDVARIDGLWSAALSRSGGSFLFGQASLADVFFAPVATRLATYGLAVSPQSQSYVEHILSLTPIRQWRALGLAQDAEVAKYEMGLPRAPFPIPSRIEAFAVETGEPENSVCPYSGRPPMHLAQIGTRVFGFCNRGCRDKTIADPEAWPAFMSIYDS